MQTPIEISCPFYLKRGKNWKLNLFKDLKSRKNSSKDNQSSKSNQQAKDRSQIIVQDQSKTINKSKANPSY